MAWLSDDALAGLMVEMLRGELWKVLVLRTGITAAVLLLTVATNSMEQDTASLASRQSAGRSDSTLPSRSEGTPCVFDFERGEVPNCVRRSAKGKPIVAPEILKQLDFDAHGLAPVFSRTEGWMYANRRGTVVVTGVPEVDNWADSFHDGLVRIVQNGKYGFANRSGRVVIAPIYDGAMSFDMGRATVCNGCQNKCAQPDCEHHFFSGGEWFQVDTKGAIVGRVRPHN